MVKVTYKGKTLAESDNTVVVEGNHYFPPDSVDMTILSESNSISECPWKGTASYYNAKIDGKKVKDIAWFYPDPNEAAEQIKGYVAFYMNKVKFE